MPRLDPEIAPVEASDVPELIAQPPAYSDGENAEYASNEKLEKLGSATVSASEYEVEDKIYDENGREKVLETPEDFAIGLVSLEDDPDLPIHTFRMWFIGIGLAVFGAVLGMLFQFRPQVILVSALFLQLIAYMLGRMFQAIIPGPGSRWHRDNWFWNFLNPGPFNLKEHVASQICANTAATAAQACFVFASDDLFYNITINPGNAIFTLLASQLIGYGFAGMFRAFLVYPTVMLYPQTLIYVNLFDVLHRSKGEVLQGKRLRFFWLVTGAIFVYEWFPEWIAPLLGSFNIVCLCARNSDWVSYIFGGAEANEGMGLLGFGLDWANITSQPFYAPLSTQISNYVGWVINYFLLPAIFASNVWNSKNFPFISENLFYLNGTVYDQDLILTSDYSLNRTAYEIYGQPWQSGSQVIYNLGINMSIGASFVHIALWHGKEIWSAFRDYFRGRMLEDVHYKRMRIYREVPMWWYGAVTAAAFVMAMVCAYTEKSDMPWWALIVALILAMFCLPFYGAMYAIAAFQVIIQNLFQMLGAALIPGSSQANMYFELYSSQSLSQAVSMLSDLKLGQYTKLPPRSTFSVQMVGTIIGALLNYVIMQTVVNNKRAVLLSDEGTRTWSGQQVQSYNANAILWGALGKEIYGPNGPYFIVPLGIIIGLALPIIPWLLYRKYKKEWLKLINTCVLAYNIGDLAGGTNGYINTWMVIGLTSHFYIRKYRAGWFRKYNYLFGAAVDGGAQVFVFIFSFALGGAGGVTVNFPNWALNPVGNADYCKVTSSEG
ncbi:OPT oligopeptide transporter [Laetiporus sulphureus 93-53]|uniref:OPT oligopeptide transporter n=1 Tax=Laetiporus sulphureus 93-53 TaxID=1314785 RepID=A0A165AYB6_9APHY|nr:OPT oligopeptide transporter [Laetiporus sulphureus 93-53]KZS99888.1 OPT oligopeptide transporter [Laetiporus sulphureus 93-53]